MTTAPLTSAATNDAAFLSGGGELGALIRAKDWSATPLGRPEAWAQSIKTAVSLCLNSRSPILLWLGPELRIVYNDAYIPFLGEAKHPTMLGAPGREAWGEVWDAIGPMLDEANAGRMLWVEDFQFFFSRRLPREEVYVTFSYGPIRSTDGTTVDGIFCTCAETTGRVIGERRLATLRDLCIRAAQQRTVAAACRHAVEVLEANPLDITFTAIYLADADGRTASRVAATRLPADGASAFPAVHTLSANEAPRRWPFAEAARTGQAVRISDLPNRFGAFAAALWPDFVQTAIVLPLPVPGQTSPAGFLVVGISPRRVLDADYRSFLDLAAEHIGAAVAEARAFEDERRRAEALAELDRAKTAFFFNVSHEFRTPLTLMLGPLEELLAKPPGDLPPDSQALAAVAHRNGLRLLRLVNSLLDFSRIEAGRVQASYEPTDLARLTAELASSFRSACERAGLQFDVACPALPEPVYVDRDMWEKIVLNLLSNAFKFTFKGGIRVSLAAVPGGAELRVADTGVGIPAADLPRVFERFHRIDGQMSRSYEGSGIGLALVQELVRLHDGQIAVDSDAECGTTFSVKLPFGTSGLPQERIGGPRALSPTPTRSAAYVEEAFRWLPEGQAQDVLPRRGEEVEANVSVTPGPRILLADDNADMRDYLARLLSTRGWEVEAVADGAAALEATRQRRPDLVLADVMMPGLSGLELAAALRREPHLAELPIILLAARAGEKARIEGLETGADDYLVKPFAARELVARVKTHLALSRLRHDAAERVRRSEAQLQAAIELVGLCPYTWDPVTGALEWGDRLRAMWGLPPGAYVDSEVFVSGIHPEDRARVMAAIAACTDPAGNGVYHLDYRVIGMGDGVERWVSTHGQTVFKAGRPVSFIGAALDITKRKRAEEQLRASEARFRQFAEHSADVLWILNAQTKRLEYLSPAFQRIWGEPPGTLLLDRIWWAETVHPEDRTTAINALERALRGEVVTLDYRIIRADGALRWIRDTLFPIFDDREQLQWAAGIAKDITKQSGIQVYVVDAEDESRYHLTLLLQRAGYQVKTFNSARAFLEVVGVLVPGCVVLNLRAPGAGGLTVSRELKARGLSLPVIIVGGEHGDVRGAVQAMRAGTSDWLEEPWEEEVLLAAIAAAVTHIQEVAKAGQTAELARTRIAVMPVREREVLAGLMAGETNKTIARRLGISPRTVEIHRAHVMEQLGVRSLSEAVLLAAAAGLAVEPRPGSSSDAG